MTARRHAPLGAVILAALVAAGIAAGLYLWASGTSKSGGGGGGAGGGLGPPGPSSVALPPGGEPFFFWDLPAELPGSVVPQPCDWRHDSEDLIAKGPTAVRSEAGLQLGTTSDGRAILWVGEVSLETGWCGFAARVEGNYTRQPQIRFVADPTPPPPPAPPPPSPPPSPPWPPPPTPPVPRQPLPPAPSQRPRGPQAPPGLSTYMQAAPVRKLLEKAGAAMLAGAGSRAAVAPQALPRAPRRSPPNPPVVLVTYPAGGYASESGMNLRAFPFDDGVIGASATLSYQVYFPPDFDFHKGGKLPGLRQGAACSGGRFEDTCFSFRLNFGTDGVAQGYVYAPLKRQAPAFWELDGTRKGTAGIIVARGSNGVRWVRGAWNSAEMRIQVNDPGVANGLLEFSVNGIVAVSFNQMYWRGNASQLIDHVFLQTFFGGNSPPWAPSTAQRTLFRRFMLTT